MGGASLGEPGRASNCVAHRVFSVEIVETQCLASPRAADKFVWGKQAVYASNWDDASLGKPGRASIGVMHHWGNWTQLGDGIGFKCST